MSRLRPPRYRKGPRTMQDLRLYLSMLTDYVLVFGLWAIISAFIASAVSENWVVNILAFWAMCSLIIIGAYCIECSDHSSSMVRMPWYKPWALALLLVTLPWLAIWLLSLVRLIISDPKKDVFKPYIRR